MTKKAKIAGALLLCVLPLQGCSTHEDGQQAERIACESQGGEYQVVGVERIASGRTTRPVDKFECVKKAE